MTVGTFATPEKFYDLLLPELPGITTAMLDYHIIETVREFLQKTDAWREDVTLDLFAGQSGYELTYFIQTLQVFVLKVFSISINESLLWVYDDSDIPLSETAPRYKSSEPPFSIDTNSNLIILDADNTPKNSITRGLKVNASFMVLFGNASQTFPAFILRQHSETIRCGTLARLMLMKKPWGDRELAMKYEQRWREGLAYAGYQGAVGNTSRKLRVKKWM